MSSLAKTVQDAMDRFNALSPEQQADHRRLQRESFVRAMTTPCEHGDLDFEQCRDCRTLQQGGSGE
jgi:hypothetical protein